MDDEAVFIKLKGELVEDNIYDLKDEYMKYLEKGATHFILDFENVSYISSMGIAAILFLHKKLVSNNGVIELINLDEKLKKFFIILELPEGFIIK